MNKFEYKNLTPFKWFVLENFPFIEADFDALTEWQLFCKLGKEMNKIINSENTLGTQVESVTNAFIELQNYVNNYFNNLDVQEEVNEKLNQMASDGTLENIINNEIFGEIQQDIININSKLSSINIGDTILIGDSYSTIQNENSWPYLLRTKLGLNSETCKIIGRSGSGFIGNSGVPNFLTLLQNNINSFSDKSKIKNIIVCGGYNDRTYSVTNIQTAIENFSKYAKQQFPNAHIYIGEIGWDVHKNNDGATARLFIFEHSVVGYSNYTINTPDTTYLNGVQYALLNKNLFRTEDLFHPNIEGEKVLADAIYQAFITGNYTKYQSRNVITINLSQGNLYSGFINCIQANNLFQILISDFIIQYSPNLTLPAGFSVKLGTYDSDYLFPLIGENATLPVVAYITTNEDKRISGPAQLYFNPNGDLILQFQFLRNEQLTEFIVKNIGIYTTSRTIIGM